MCVFKNLILKFIFNMRKVFVIVYVYLWCFFIFLDKNFSVVYLVLGKVYWNWVIIDMWVVWFSVLIVDVGNLSIFLIKLK